MKRIVVLSAVVFFVLLLLVFLCLYFLSEAVQRMKAPNPSSISHHEELSNTGMEGSEYTCSGTCFCGDEDTWRRSTGIMKASLTLPVIAISSAFAIAFARSSFNSECIGQFSGVCAEKDISSEVEFCEERKDTPLAHIKVHDWSDYIEEFSCSGHCVPNGRLLRPDRARKEAKKAIEEFRCEKLKIDNVIIRVKIPDTGGKYFQKRKKDGGMKYQESGGTPMLNNRAQLAFMAEHLVSFCRAKSVWRYRWLYRTPQGYDQKRTKETNLCVASPGTTKKMKNWSNVYCEKIGSTLKPLESS